MIYGDSPLKKWQQNYVRFTDKNEGPFMSHMLLEKKNLF